MRANVAIYPVDARGLVATAPGGDATSASPKGTGARAVRCKPAASAA